VISPHKKAVSHSAVLTPDIIVDRSTSEPAGNDGDAVAGGMNQRSAVAASMKYSPGESKKFMWLIKTYLWNTWNTWNIGKHFVFSAKFRVG
jgi:hypothetical protein